MESWCTLAEGARGVCGVRFSRQGQLRVPHGYVARRYVRAIETNTIFNVAPGTRALSFGMYGCDLRCPYCHNHRISQALRDGSAAETPTPISAAALVAEARAAECSAVCAAYNEPLISAEWVREVFEAAKQHGLLTALISDGNATAETLRWLRPATDVLRIDLKADSDARYRALGGRLQPVLDAIELGRMLGYWVEVVTLVVPGLTQDQKQIARIGAMLREIDPALPWHLNGFVARYRLQSSPPASAVFMMVAAAAAYSAGTHYVYVGNVPHLTELNHTRCPKCRDVVVRRRNFEMLESSLNRAHCPACDEKLPGIWSRSDAFSPARPGLPATHGTGAARR